MIGLTLNTHVFFLLLEIEFERKCIPNIDIAKSIKGTKTNITFSSNFDTPSLTHPYIFKS